jgi:hypothetical protein
MEFTYSEFDYYVHTYVGHSSTSNDLLEVDNQTQ